MADNSINENLNDDMNEEVKEETQEEIKEENNEIMNEPAGDSAVSAVESAIEEAHIKVNDKKTKSVGREIFEWVYSIAIAVVIALLIKGFLFDIVKVDGRSMENTLFNGDRLIITKLGYEPQQGDIIILDSNYSRREQYYDKLAKNEGKDELSSFEKIAKTFSLPPSCKRIYYVKRVIATEGQTVDIRDGVVYVDGTALDEPYAKGITYPTDMSVEYPVTVQEDCVFVMGDNREHSSDSRVSGLGQVQQDAILGKSQVRIFPFSSFGLTK